ncbi:hypothetical protein [Flavihumibacter sp. CACIAM 22H1]|uniref:HYC_CC_PP family protein n=1 Tax=Flavihumibacter sp. CACIAM 22H1 TaxID=1812911 RepID=UPI0025B90938|nr:hypothetical protein [Flavihumibacter sp. CACIAM 22H1]
MKKIFAISLAVLYLLVSSGILVEIHHCMGRFSDASVHVFSHSPKEGECGKCGMPKSEEFSHCCKDEIKLVKVDDEQKAGGVYYQIDAPVALVNPQPWASWTSPEPLSEKEQLPPVHGPPPDQPASFQSFYCIFRI